MTRQDFGQIDEIIIKREPSYGAEPPLQCAVVSWIFLVHIERSDWIEVKDRDCGLRVDIMVEIEDGREVDVKLKA